MSVPRSSTEGRLVSVEELEQGTDRIDQLNEADSHSNCYDRKIPFKIKQRVTIDISDLEDHMNLPTGRTEDQEGGLNTDLAITHQPTIADSINTGSQKSQLSFSNEPENNIFPSTSRSNTFIKIGAQSYDEEDGRQNSARIARRQIEIFSQGDHTTS